MRLILVILLCTVCEIIGAPKRARCPTPRLNHGRVRYSLRSRYAKFKCNAGYILAGEKYGTCENGVWDGPPPKCVRNSCIKVQAPPNVIIYPSHRGGVLNFFCKPGFALRGDNITYCDGKKWDNRLPTCLESSTTPALICDFESEELCGWTHDLLHDFDWKRKNSRTPSGHLDIGPSYDHTKGSVGEGYYMYVESSSRDETETARLISPIYDRMNDSNVCLEFFYYMHGSMTSELRVHLKKLSDGWDLDPDKALFRKIGNHGNMWLDSWHNLGRIDEDFQVIIECIRGKSIYSGIAIDDVQIIPNCSEYFTTESDISYSFDDKSVPSCLNRCDILSNSDEYPCDCEESCVYNNTCCYDYVAVCILGGTEEYETTTEDDEFSTFLKLENTAMPTIKMSKAITTMKTTASRIPTTTTKQTVGTTTKHVVKPTTRVSRTTPKATNATTRTKPTTTTKRTVKTTPKPTSTTTRTKPTTTTKRTVKTTPKSTSTTTRTKQTTPKATTTTNITKAMVVPSTTQIISFSDDVGMIPNIPNDLEPDEIFTVNAITVKTVDIAAVDQPQPNTKVIIIISIVAVIVGAILTIVGVIKYRVTCRNLKKIKSSHGDSQSDVRFLTSDEILNFNLAYVDD